MTNSNIYAKRAIRFSDDGFTAFVTLATGEVAMIDREDYERFVQEGVSLNWSKTKDRHGNGPYVHVWHKHLKNIVTVSRLIMRAGKGQVISFRNGNRLDLRKHNLKVDNGPAWRRTESTRGQNIFLHELEAGNANA